MDWYVIFLIVGMFCILLSFYIVQRDKKSEKENRFDEDFKRVLREKEASYEKRINRDNFQSPKIIDNSRGEVLNSLKDKNNLRVESVQRDFEKEEILKTLKEIRSDNEVEKRELKRDNSFVEIKSNLRNEPDEPIKEKRVRENKSQEKIIAYRNGRSLVENSENSTDSMTGKILQLKDEGYSPGDISKMMNRGIREVEMIININKKS